MGKGLKQSQNSIYKLAHVCATSGKAVNSSTPIGIRAGTKNSHPVDIVQ
jgi:hypothetical protein